jgi:hypothetical protein
MKRGDVVTVAGSGDCGKPRPAVIVVGQRGLWDERFSAKQSPAAAQFLLEGIAN